MIAISNLNTYNFIFIMLGLLLHWRPKRFLAAVVKFGPGDVRCPDPVSVLWRHSRHSDRAKNGAGDDGFRSNHPCLRQYVDPASLSAGDGDLFRRYWASSFRQVAESGCSKLPTSCRPRTISKVHLGWAVQVYNAAEALPNLINPFLDVAAPRRFEFARA